jgi:hypothetical protein
MFQRPRIPRLEIFQEEHSTGEEPSEFRVHGRNYASGDIWRKGCTEY